MRLYSVAIGFLMKKNPILILVLLVMVFAAVWAYLAGSLTGWSDELTHMSVAQGLLRTGTYTFINLDSGAVSDYYPHGLYTRGRVISLMAEFFCRLLGFSLLSARFLPLLFTLLTFLVFAAYARWRHKLTWQLLLLAAVFFFGQAMVLEKSLYVRMYAPLALVLLLSLIVYWEGLKRFENGKKLPGILLMLAGFALVSIPILDTWHYQQITVFFVAVFAGLKVKNSSLLAFVFKNRRRSLFIIAAVLISFPCVLLVLNSIVSRLPIGNRVMGNNFITYWDNIAGFIRFIWGVNVCFWGILFLGRDEGKSRELEFFSWLFITGVISGVFTALYTSHNFIFYSRFFYLPVVLIVLGFPILLAKSGKKPEVIKKLTIAYVILNILLSFSTFYFDRSNIKEPVSWLKSNLNKDDLLFIFSAELLVHGGAGLTSRAVIVPATKEPGEIRKILEIVNASRAENVYFLYTNHYELRDRLYFLTTGGLNRSPGADLFRYLRDNPDGQFVLKGLRGCGLKKFSRNQLISDLNALLLSGYPEPFISPEVRVLQKLKK